MIKLKYVVPVSIGVGIIVLLSVVDIAAARDLSGLESVLLQIMSLAIGSGVSFYIGRQSAQSAAREIIKPHARSAFRRLVSLYRSLQRAATTIEAAQGLEADENREVTLAKLEVIVSAQLTTADDALEDWRDIVPEDVNEIHQKLQHGYTTGDTK